MKPHDPGITSALLSALLFGAGTPLAKMLLGNVSPWAMAGLLYLGSGIGLALYRRICKATPAHLPGKEIPWLLGAILSGGVAAPVLLMAGLKGMPASGASLLLNTEGVFTTLLAWFAFRENFDRRIALGMIAILSGALILSWPSEIQFSGLLPSLSILCACLLWGIDNNLTRKVSLSDASWIASVKGLSAGSVNLALAFFLGDSLPPPANAIGAAFVGFFAYGVSLSLFVVGLRHLGAARTGAYFSSAPFFGVLLSLLMGEAMSITLVMAGALMLFGVWLHLTENHEHEHFHEAIEHDHEHVHDMHHLHTHATEVPPGTRHSHFHRHEPMLHTHPHFPDMHHLHPH